MSNIDDQIKNARTMEDIVNLLSILFTNLNNQNEMYYDMFLNPVPMDLNLERYDEDGQLVTVTLPNVAKMRISSYSGAGNPNGRQAATIGALYIDTNTRSIYYKATGSDSYGWQLVWSTANLVEGVDFLSPIGDGSQLQNLSANNITSGTLPVTRGGTGTRVLSGILKGNGTNAVTTAIAGEDYLVPGSLTGLIMYCPTATIPDGWLICDGTIYNITERPELAVLCNKLGNKYGGDGISTFGVPSIIGRYIKGGVIADVGKTDGAKVGKHTHTVKGTTANDGAHTHNRGTMNITASGFMGEANGSGNYAAFRDQAKGALYYGGGSSNYGSNGGIDKDDLVGIFDASRSWTGSTSSTPHQHSINLTSGANSEDNNDVDHIVMVPIIKY